MSTRRILWADDEIDLLKPHILFLKNKGYEVTTANNGRDALDMVMAASFDLVILDENMPGLTGLETLALIKEQRPEVPVIMITKSEEENIMDQAVGSKIADYLIKPVNPSQILIAIKKQLHSDRLVTEKVAGDYRQEFGRIASLINSAQTIDDWYDLYGALCSARWSWPRPIQIWARCLRCRSVRRIRNSTSGYAGGMRAGLIPIAPESRL